MKSNNTKEPETAVNYSIERSIYKNSNDSTSLTQTGQVSAFRLCTSNSSNNNNQQNEKNIINKDNNSFINVNNKQQQMTNYFQLYQNMICTPTQPQNDIFSNQSNQSNEVSTPKEFAMPSINLEKQKSQVQEIKKSRVCNCRKTKCLKLYCDCFAVGELCGPECKCLDCSNNQETLKIRNEAIVQILEKNPYAFNSKDENELKLSQKNNKKGCNCRKSACQKKYCYCWSEGLKCNELCKCSECENISPKKKIKLDENDLYIKSSYHEQNNHHHNHYNTNQLSQSDLLLLLLNQQPSNNYNSHRIPDLQQAIQHNFK